MTSGGELFRALQAGGDPKKMIYAGVGKTDRGDRATAINAGIAAFNLESEAEIENVDRVAGAIGKKAIGAIRINPDVDPPRRTPRRRPARRRPSSASTSSAPSASSSSTAG